MKLKKNDIQILVLVALIIVAVAGYYVIKAVTEKKAVNKDDMSQVILQFNTGDIKKIEFLDYANNKNVVLSKTNNLWNFSEPSSYIANSQACDSYIGNLLAINYDNKIVSPKKEDMSFYGLDKQKKEIIVTEINSSAEKKWTFAIGSMTPTQDKQYVYHREADIVYILDNQYVTYLDANIEDLRNKNVFYSIERERIAYIQFENKIDGIKNTFTLKDGKWQWEPNFVKQKFTIEPTDNAMTALLDRVVTFLANKIIDDAKPLSYGEYYMTVKNADGSLVIPVVIKDPLGDLPPEQRTYTVFNKKTNETFEVSLTIVYTFFTPTPLYFSNLLPK